MGITVCVRGLTVCILTSPCTHTAMVTPAITLNAYGDSSLAPYAYGDPRTHTGICPITKCVRGFKYHKSRYAYRDPRMHTGAEMNYRMHNVICLISVCVLGFEWYQSPYAYGDRDVSPYAYRDLYNHITHTGIQVVSIPVCMGIITVPVCIRGDLKSLYVYCD
jgi:hypothetical protein